jgi:hypothetical protein
VTQSGVYKVTHQTAMTIAEVPHERVTGPSYKTTATLLHGVHDVDPGHEVAVAVQTPSAQLSQ